MAKIKIGNVEYTVPELTFMALERAWPYVEASMISVSGDPMRGPNAALRIIAAGIVDGENFDPARYNVKSSLEEEDAVHDEVVNFFRRRLKAREIPLLKDCIDEILVEAGLVAPEGEDTPPSKEAVSLSTETVLGSSQSS